jgi:hypothetical protein
MLSASRSRVEQILGGEIPSTYLAAHILCEEEGMFAVADEKDVRRSLRVGEVPMPELAPDEVLIAVMASAINYNTVWSARRMGCSPRSSPSRRRLRCLRGNRQAGRCGTPLVCRRSRSCVSVCD